MEGSDKTFIDFKKKELSCAPMLKITTPCFRHFMRLICSEVVLFSEMIVANTVINVTDVKLKYLLGDAEERTVVQIGGSDPVLIVDAIKRLVSLGHKMFNLNCGCPSDRVQAGMFGAILMLHPDIVITIINRVYEETGIIISLKIRTGVDENDSYEFLYNFVETIIKNTPCKTFYVHARKCWLKGLNPKQNRNIPKLEYENVYRLKKDFGDCFIGLNGGINEKNANKVSICDGIMIGREAWNNMTVFNDILNKDVDFVKALKEYFCWVSKTEYSLSKILHPIINLRKGRGNNKLFKQTINNIMHKKPEIDKIFEIICPFFK